VSTSGPARRLTDSAAPDPAATPLAATAPALQKVHFIRHVTFGPPRSILI
jgi:hypothetical protein